MWPVKLAMKSSHMQSVEPAMPQYSYQQCQVKSRGIQSSQLQSVSKAAREQIGTQPEVLNNIDHSTSKCCYPSGSTNMCPDSVQIQSNHSPDSRSYKMKNHQMKSVNLGKMQSNHMQQVKTELKKSQVNTSSQVQTSKYKRDTKNQA